MWLPDPGLLADRLSQSFGLSLTGVLGRDGRENPWIEIRPAELHRHEGFCVRIELGWRSLHAIFIPGPFASGLIGEMGKATSQSQAMFVELVLKSIGEGAKVSMGVNGGPVGAADVSSWPLNWQRLDLSLDKSPLAINTEDYEENDLKLECWARRFMAMALALMPLEAVESAFDENPEGLPEGASVRMEVNRYERNHANRANCIEILGDSCKGCGFNFGRAYGPLGRGFIHVHHVVPVSKLGPGYMVDPVTDLVPLCPNCHAMVHRRSPPFSVSELRKLLATGDLTPPKTFDGEP